MQGLKKVLELFKLDWKRIFNNKLTLALMIALMIIPSLYAWFNIAALWDPYSNTKDIKIAVYSDDKATTVMDKEVAIGEKVLDNLKENDTLSWQFADSKEEMDKGVKSGKYYASVYIPSDFSENLVSFVDGDIKQPEIEYSVNQKINAIAPKISDKGAGTIKDNISTEFVNTVSKTVMDIFNEIGFNLDNNLPSIKRLTGKILELDNNLDKIDGYAQEVVKINNKMPEYKNKLSKANEFVGMMPELNKSANKIVEFNKKVPDIEEAGQLVYQLQDKIPQIKNAGQQINMIDKDFGQIVIMMDQAIKEANNGLQIISDAQKVLPEVKKLAETSNKVIPDLKKNLDKVQQALPNIAQGVDSGLQIVKTVSKSTAKITSDLANMIGNNELTPQDINAIHTHLTDLSGRLSSQETMIQSVIDLLNNLQDVSGSNDLNGVIGRLQQAKTLVIELNNKVKSVLNNWDSIVASPVKFKEALKDISSKANNINNIVSGIDTGAIKSKVDKLIKDAQEILKNAGNITGTIIDQDLINRLDKLMTSTSGTIKQAVSFLEKYRKEMPAIQQEIHSANELLNGNMNLIINGINDGSDFFKNDFPTLKNKLNKTSNFIQNDLPGVESNIEGTMKTVNDKVPKVEEALSSATTIIKEDWPNIKTKIHEGADFIRKGEEDIDLEEVIKLLKNDANEESNFLSNPIDLKTNDVYPIPNYGSASTPFYTALCLWVGAVLFSSIASTKFTLDNEQKLKYTKRQQFLGRMLTFLTVGFFQALIVTVGNQLLLGSYTVHPFLNILFALIIDLSFMMMVYVLVALFNNLGKGLAVIILVLSISAGGGNFPIEMSGPFFRAIHPFIPFTHAVNLLRESVGGIYWPSATKALIILISITVAFFLVGYFLYPKAEKLFSKINNNLKKGHILH